MDRWPHVLVLAEQALLWVKPVHRVTGAAFLVGGSMAIATAIA